MTTMTRNDTDAESRRAVAMLDPATKRALELAAFRIGWDRQDVAADAILQWLDGLEGLLAAEPAERLRRHVAAIDQRDGTVPDELRALLNGSAS